MKYIFRKILTTLFLVIAATILLPEQTLVNAAPAQSQSQREKQKAQKQKQKQRKKEAAQRKKAQKQKQKQRKKEQKQKQKDRNNQRKVAAADKRDERNEAEQYRAEVARVQKHNERVMRSSNRNIHHYLGVWGQAGYSALLLNNNANLDFRTKTIGGFGGGAGLGYQLNYEHFLFNAGLQFDVFNSQTRLLNTGDNFFSQTYDVALYPSMKYTYYFNNFKDKTQAGYLNIPLLFGGEWGRWYFLAGPKFGFSLIGKSLTSSLLTTKIDDNEIYGPAFEDMPTHALVTDRPYDGNAEKLKFGLNLGLHAEAGIYLDEWLRPNKQQNSKTGSTQQTFFDRLRYRVGVFAEYGVLNIQTAGNAVEGRNLPVGFNDNTNPLDLSMLPMLTIDRMKQTKVNPFIVGVKLAIFCELPRKQQKLLPMPQEPLPRMAALVLNQETERPVQGAMLAIHSVEKQRTISKTTGKTGLIVQKQRKGEYLLSAQRAGFMPSDTLRIDHQQDLQDTIVVFLRPVPKPLEPMLSGFIYDNKSNLPLEAKLSITDLAGTILYEGQASEEGEFVTALKAGTYLAHLTAQGYMPQDDTISFVSTPLTLTMQRIIEGKKVVLKNMFFATNKTQILQESESTLEELANFLTENPSIEIRIIGHTDAVGSEQANQRLSEGRAAAVRQNLIMRGIEADRITSEGRGKSEPIADNSTEEGRQKNRRVEIEITATGDSNIQQIKDVL